MRRERSNTSLLSWCRMVFKKARAGSGENSFSPMRDLAISNELGPLKRITPIALRPGGVANATIVSIPAHPAIARVDSRSKNTPLFGVALQGDFESAFRSISDRFCVQIFIHAKCEVNDSPFVCVHRAKGKSLAARAYLPCGMQRHRP